MKIVSITFIMLMSVLLLNAQEKQENFKPKGVAFGKVFFNYHLDLTEGSDKVNSFEIQRSYLGYKYNFSDKISAKITLDAGPVGVGSSYTVFVKIAQLNWQISKPIKLSIGLIGLKQFDTQEKFWGYRYIFKSFQDEFAFGSSADLGANAEIKIIKNLTANVFVLNGEGYKKKQDNMGRLKVGGNLVYKPINGLILKAYYDIYGGKFNRGDTLVVDTTSIQTIAFFAGYKINKFRLGAEYDLQKGGEKYYHIAADHNLRGYVIYGTYMFAKKWEVFAEYFSFKSNKLEGETDTWNYNKDANGIVGGFQYSPVKGVKASLNYRTFLYDNPKNTDENLIYLNFEYKF